MNSLLRKRFIEELFYFLSSYEDKYVWLKAVVSHPTEIATCSDLDLLVKKDFLPTVRNFCITHHLVAFHNFKAFSHCTYLELFFEDGGFLQVDLLTGLVRKELRYLTNDYVFSHRTKINGVSTYQPQVMLEHVMLFNFLNGSGIPYKYVRFFSQFNDREQYKLFTFINEKYGTDFCSIQSMTVFKPHRLAAIQKYLLSQKENSLLKRAFRATAWLFDTAIAPLNDYGKIITFSGVDGAGKSTILGDLKEVLKNKYRKKVVVLRHRPSILPILSAWTQGKENAEAKAAATLPRQGKNHSKLSSIIRFAYYYTDYLLGQWVVWAKYLLRGYVVLYDRYYFDFIADGRRSNIALGEAIPKWLYRFVWKPDLNIFLYAHPVHIRKRKQELSEEAISELTHRYLKLFEAFSQKHAGKHLPIENMNRQATLEAILKAFAATAAKPSVKTVSKHLNHDKTTTNLDYSKKEPQFSV
ncbi:MAG: hypothetical protein Kow0027_15020 [Saprospiraceae bacterium]